MGNPYRASPDATPDRFSEAWRLFRRRRVMGACGFGMVPVICAAFIALSNALPQHQGAVGVVTVVLLMICGPLGMWGALPSCPVCGKPFFSETTTREGTMFEKKCISCGAPRDATESALRELGLIDAKGQVIEVRPVPVPVLETEPEAVPRRSGYVDPRWRRLRKRRLAAFAGAIGMIVVGITTFFMTQATGEVGDAVVLLVPFLASFGVFVWSRVFPCPLCNERFAYSDGVLHLSPKACLHCGARRPD